MSKQSLWKFILSWGNFVRWAGEHGLRRQPFISINRVFFKVVRSFTKKYKTESVQVGKHIMFLDVNDSLSLTMDTNFEPLETEIIAVNIKPGDVVLDIGANIGYHTLKMADIVGPTGLVFAFEPDPNNFVTLTKNIEANGYKNIIAVNKAVSNKPGKLKLYIDKFNKGGHRIYSSFEKRESVEIEATSLDDYFKGSTFIIDKKISFIKMDVEGAEPLVIEGAKRLIENSPNIKMITEYYPLLIDECCGKGAYSIFLSDLMNIFPYTIFEIDEYKNKKEYINFDELISRKNPKVGNGTNLLCIKNGDTNATKS